jgi:lipid A 4'-phosphatase
MIRLFNIKNRIKCSFFNLGKFLINRLNLVFGLLLFFTSLIFYEFPNLDLQISRLFYSDLDRFVFAENIFVYILFKSVPTLTILFAIILIIIALRSYFYKKDFKRASLSVALIISLVIGPGITVNSILKDNFGRARPKQITEFGGQKNFSKVFVMTDQCKKNCSFSSGHAAAAFSFSSVAFIVSPQYQLIYYISGIVFGFIVGVGRIIQGGHFASDVLVSASIVLLINYFIILIYLKIFKSTPVRPQNHKV